MPMENRERYPTGFFKRVINLNCDRKKNLHKE